MKNSNLLQEERQKKGVLIASHRGVAGGNIPCNTMKAFEIALRQGADILETDVTLCGDGELFIFHPGKEDSLLNLPDTHIGKMTSEEVKKLRYVNLDDELTDDGLPTLDEFLETYKNRCLINLDHAWDNGFVQVLDKIRYHGMEDQILMKAPSELQYAKIMEEVAPDIMFMPLIKHVDPITAQLEKMKLNFVGLELVFANEESPLIAEEYLRYHKSKGRMLWANAIIYNYNKQLTAGHSDDIAVSTGDMDYGWGWLVEKGFDIIQTDWVLELSQYLRK